MPNRLSFFSLSGTFGLIVIRRTSRRVDVLVSLPACPSLLRERTEWKEMVDRLRSPLHNAVRRLVRVRRAISDQSENENGVRSFQLTS